MIQEKELIQAANKNRLYDYIANNYHDMSPWQAKEVILAILGVCYDKCCGDEDEEALMQLIIDELAERGFGIDDDDN